MALAPAAVVVGALGCERCGARERAEEAPHDAARPSSSARAPTLAVVEGWRWRELVGRPRVALPRGCTHRERPLGAEVPETTRWRTAHDELGTLLVALGPAQDNPTPSSAADSGVEWQPSRAGVVRWAPDRAGELAPRAAPAPWLGCSGCPAAYDRATKRWLLAWSEPARESLRRLLIWRGGETELVAEGDALEAVALECTAQGRCALLATEPAAVARGGAAIWIGKADTPIGRWRAVPLDLESSEPFAPIALDFADGSDEPVLSLLHGSSVRFAALDQDGRVEPHGELDAPHGALDAAATPFAAALTRLRPADTDCSAGAALSFARASGMHRELATPLAPTSGTLHPLRDGYLVTLLVPQRCDGPAAVAYGALAATEAGEPPELVALAEADDVAVATAGADVDLWLRRGRSATWIRARCTSKKAASDAAVP